MAQRIKMVKYLDSFNTPDYDIRPVEKERIRDIAQIMLDAYVSTPDYEGESLNDLTKELSMLFRGYFGTYLEDASLALFNDSGEPVSFLFTCDFKGEPTLTYLFTKKGHLGRGYATNLLKAAENALLTLDYDRLILYVSKENTPALNLYLKLGFMEIPVNSSAIDREFLEEVRERELSGLMAVKEIS